MQASGAAVPKAGTNHDMPVLCRFRPMPNPPCIMRVRMGDVS